MKVVWLSPYGNGWAIAERMRRAGNKVVYWCPNKNGSGYLPEVPWSRVEGFINQADLVVCDGNFSSRPTRRSWEASDQVMLLNAVIKKRGVPYIGPIPTSELIANDERYQRKIAKRCGLSLIPVPEQGVSVVILSIDPSGRLSIVLRQRSEAINLADVVVAPTAVTEPVKQLIKDLPGFLRSIGYNGYINLELAVSPDGLKLTGLDTGFLYPAIFAQWSLPPTGNVTQALIALTVLSSHPNIQKTGLDQIVSLPGFFGAEIHLNGDKAALHGEICGAGIEQHIDPNTTTFLTGLGLL